MVKNMGRFPFGEAGGDATRSRCEAVLEHEIMTTSKPILASESNESSRVRFSAVLALCSAVRHSVL